jgi:hypothetical protein
MTENLKNGQRVFVINGVQHIITLEKTSFTTSVDPGKYEAKSFIGDMSDSLWVSDPEGMEEDFRLKVQYITGVFDSTIVGGEDPSSLDDDQTVDESQEILSENDQEEEDDVQRAIREQKEKMAREKELQNQQQQNENNDATPIERKKRHRSRSRSNNKNKNNKPKNNKTTAPKNNVVNQLKDEKAFDELYYEGQINFGIPASIEEFSNILAGKSAINLAVRFEYTNDVNQLGSVVVQKLSNPDCHYAIAHVGYINPLDGESNVNYFALVLACQKLNVLFAGKTIALHNPAFEDADKVSKIFERQLNAISEVYICS